MPYICDFLLTNDEIWAKIIRATSYMPYVLWAQLMYTYDGPTPKNALILSCIISLKQAYKKL